MKNVSGSKNHSVVCTLTCLVLLNVPTLKTPQMYAVTTSIVNLAMHMAVVGMVATATLSRNLKVFLHVVNFLNFA